ncbi:alpha-ketoacid dehydrogenase subunit alpha/beta [Schleiferia thermophila]|uniref:alpha-ketoacid dehydrogenase subunit alpha/beta n=1 Tax=Schleiferia thermophila TaxID=884107 RepID=UPI003EEDACF9
MNNSTGQELETGFEIHKNEVVNDYALAVESREASLIGRREVLTGKAKFGIFGDGKEVAQIAWAKAFKPGDFRSGYYRDQTFMMAIGALTTQEFFASLYADTDLNHEPASGGRQMNGHFATRSLNSDGSWKNLSEMKNSSADISPTASQMPRLVGLAQASKIYRHMDQWSEKQKFSNNGNEIAWGTIGNASTSEGLFFEAINAAGVLQIPMVVSVWDDDYGISVHSKHQTTKESISEILSGFQRGEKPGYEIFVVKGWDYPALIETYKKAEKIARDEHVPVLIHVVEMTQPQGHSTSGSHERYKSKERLEWEREFDCIRQMRLWIEANGIATPDELDEIEKAAKKAAREARSKAWKDYITPILDERAEALRLLHALAQHSVASDEITSLSTNLEKISEPLRRDIITAVRKSLRLTLREPSNQRAALEYWLNQYIEKYQTKYSSHLYSQSQWSALNIREVKPTYSEQSPEVDGRIVLRENFDQLLSSRPEVLIFGEDSGKIGDVNQGLEGLQSEHGEMRVSDTGIREATILGQGIGLAMRGLRPIAEIQYLDYLLYALQIMSDDLATVQYRTVGGQKAPVIVRTRGHRLEGIWHSGSPMGAIVHSMRGIYVLVPRDMTKAAGFYNTMLDSDDTALIIECLNGYRLKERIPDNLSEIRTPIGVVETIRTGKDLTVVTYGSNCRIALEAAEELSRFGIEIEVIDVQSLIPFDIHHDIVKSLKKTNRIIFFDEDVPGGASAYMMQQVLEVQGGYRWLDSAPRTLTSKDHRPAYGSDGDYFSKPSADDLCDLVIEVIKEAEPSRFS